jgi:hypothetical protein
MALAGRDTAVMGGRRPALHAVRLVAIIAILVLCMWIVYRVFIDIPPAPPPQVTISTAPQSSRCHAVLPGRQPTPSGVRTI